MKGGEWSWIAGTVFIPCAPGPSAFHQLHLLIYRNVNDYFYMLSGTFLISASVCTQMKMGRSELAVERLHIAREYYKSVLECFKKIAVL